MATASNPLTGSSWGSQNPNQNNNAAWINQSVNPGNFGSIPQPPNPLSTPSGAPGGSALNPGGLANPFTNIKDITRNTGLENLMTGDLRNQLIPQFASLMTGYAGPAANFFNTLMNLGSPYYQQKQAESFNQGVQQNQNAAAQARQGLQAQGYGYAPSGATAAMLGGMNQAGAQSLSEQYLQNLFQNENLQAQGAQGLSQLAAMFNPSSLFGNVSTPGSTQGPAAAEQAAAVIGSIFGSGGFNKKNF